MTRHHAPLIRHAHPLGTTDPLGAEGEHIAVAHLDGDDGLEVVARNWALRRGEVRGELDVVALDHALGLVVVVEVKTRRSDAFGGPLLAVTPRKQQQIRTLTAALLVEAQLPYRRVRFDVVAVWLPRAGDGVLEHREGAF